MSTEYWRAWLEELASGFDGIDDGSAERARAAARHVQELNEAVMRLAADGSKLWLARGWVSGYIEALELQGRDTLTLDELKRIQEVLE